MARKRRTARTVCLLLCIAISIAGCGQQESTQIAPNEIVAFVTPDSNGNCPAEGDEQGFMTFSQLSAAATCVSYLFGWPEGRYPDLVSAPNENYENGRFESGYQYTTVSSSYQCAWLGYWVDIQNTGTEEQQRQVTDYIVTNLPSYADTVPGFPSGLQDPSVTNFLQQMTNSIRLGDVADVMQFTKYNCQEGGWLPLPSDMTPVIPAATPHTKR